MIISVWRKIRASANITWCNRLNCIQLPIHYGQHLGEAAITKHVLTAFNRVISVSTLAQGMFMMTLCINHLKYQCKTYPIWKCQVLPNIEFIWMSGFYSTLVLIVLAKWCVVALWKVVGSNHIIHHSLSMLPFEDHVWDRPVA